MSKLVKSILVALFGLSLVFVFTTVPPMANQKGPDCTAYCLSANHLPDSVPNSAGLVLLLAAVIVALIDNVWLILDGCFRINCLNRARPSPDLVTLYAHYLD